MRNRRSELYYLHLFTAPREFLDCSKGGGETQEDTSPHVEEDGGEKPGKPKQLQHIKEDPRDLQFPPEQSTSQYTHAVAIQGQEPSERSKGMVPNTQTMGNSIYFYH